MALGAAWTEAGAGVAAHRTLAAAGSAAGEGGIKLNDGDNTRLTKYWMLTFSNFSYISTPKELLLLVTH